MMASTQNEGMVMPKPRVHLSSPPRSNTRSAAVAAPQWLWFGWLIGGAIALALAAPVRAAQSGAAAGHEIAQANCAGCHVITSSGKASWTDAPSFVSIANRARTTKESLVAQMMKPNMKMMHQPRSAAEARVLADYILSLRQP